ncbi:MAG: toprim domain-containing protein [Candidatus Aenigmarchaeota archaeon]|nr:toprim domain-containing protein [Candidatus Aenigmarchaeota archaeon]
MLIQEVKEELFKALEITKGKQVIVEGKRDKLALCLLGFKNIIELNTGIYEIVEKLNGKNVVILTDYDKEGIEIAKKLNKILPPLGYKVDTKTRKKIGFLFAELKIRKIEELRGVING